MEYKIEPHRLVITITEKERKELQELKDEDPDNFGTDSVMHDVFERLVANSELDWVDPSVTGDLTSAPMLAIFGDEEPGAGGRLAGRWPDKAGVMQTWYHLVLKRWAFMDYQIISPQQRLLDKGQCRFEGGEV